MLSNPLRIDFLRRIPILAAPVSSICPGPFDAVSSFAESFPQFYIQRTAPVAARVSTATWRVAVATLSNAGTVSVSATTFIAFRSALTPRIDSAISLLNKPTTFAPVSKMMVATLIK